MRHHRITIAHLVVVVVVAAIGFAALRSASAPWTGAMVSITFFVMTCSLLGVVLERDMHRIYWSGFATLGWTYLFLTHSPWLYQQVGRHLLAPNLPDALLEVLQPAPPGGGGLQSVPVGMSGASIAGGGFGGGGAGGIPFWTHVNVLRICKSIEALLWAVLGGSVACYFASGRDRRRQRQGAPPTTAARPNTPPAGAG